MADLNPYEPVRTVADQASHTPPRTRSSKRWALVGFLIAAAFPIAGGINLLQTDAAYQASLPEPEKYNCGMGMLAAVMAIVIVAPSCGFVGALIGFGLSKLPRIF